MQELLGECHCLCQCMSVLLNIKLIWFLKRFFVFYVDSLIFLQSCILFLFIISYFSPGLKFYVFLSFCVFHSFCFVLITTNKKWEALSASEKSRGHCVPAPASSLGLSLLVLSEISPWDAYGLHSSASLRLWFSSIVACLSCWKDVATDSSSRPDAGCYMFYF